MSEPESRSERYDLAADETVANGVYAVVATLEGVTETDLEPLGETIDPDALNRLLSNGSQAYHVVFGYEGYDITATEDWVEAAESSD